MSRKLATIRDEFLEAVLDDKAGLAQINDMTIAFDAGMLALFDEITTVGADLDAIRDELIAIVKFHFAREGGNNGTPHNERL